MWEQSSDSQHSLLCYIFNVWFDLLTERTGIFSHTLLACCPIAIQLWLEMSRNSGLRRAWDHPGNQGPRPESSNEGVAVWLFSLSSRQIIGLHFSVGKQINNGKYQQSGRYLFWLSRLKLTKYWPLSLNRIWMGDILSNTSWGRRAERVIILWSFCSLLTGLLKEDAWKIIHDENVQ